MLKRIVLSDYFSSHTDYRTWEYPVLMYKYEKSEGKGKNHDDSKMNWKEIYSVLARQTIHNGIIIS